MEEKSPLGSGRDSDPELSLVACIPQWSSVPLWIIIRSANRNVRVGTNVKRMAGSHFQIFNLDDIMTVESQCIPEKEGKLSNPLFEGLTCIDLLMQCNQTFKY